MSSNGDRPVKTRMQKRTIDVELPREMWLRLDRLAEALPRDQKLSPLQSLIVDLLDHVQQGVYRSGAWERQWLEQCVGPEAVAAAYEAEVSPF